MPSTETDFMDRIADAINVEFAAEGITCLPDRLHDSITHRAAGVSPDRIAVTDAGIVVAAELSVQVFDSVDLQIDPEQRVDPRIISGWAWRLMRRFESTAPDGHRWSTVDSGNAYWFNVVEVNYPEDPTGNKSRFEMSIDGFGPNPTMVETLA